MPSWLIWMATALVLVFLVLPAYLAFVVGAWWTARRVARLFDECDRHREEVSEQAKGWW